MVAAGSGMALASSVSSASSGVKSCRRIRISTPDSVAGNPIGMRSRCCWRRSEERRVGSDWSSDVCSSDLLKREFGLLGREELPQNPDLHAGFGGRKPDRHAVEMLLELAIESAGFHILPLWPDADGEQVFASTDIERAIGNRGGGHHGLAELVFGEHLVLAAGGQDEAVAVLVNDVDLVAGGHGRTAEAARPAAETLLVQPLSRGQLHNREHAIVEAEVTQAAREQRGLHVVAGAFHGPGDGGAV